MTDTKTSKFAVIETGGKQYKVAEGDVITIEKLDGDLSEGDTVTFDRVLLVDDGNNTELGAPTLSSKVTGELLASGKGKKLRVMRFRSKSRYTRRYGHRQPCAKVKITSLA